MSGNENLEAISNDARSTLLVGPRKFHLSIYLCQLFIDILKWTPVLFVTLLLYWGYYIYTIEICFKNSNDSVIYKILSLVIFNFLFFMTFWSYGKTVLVEAGQIPEEFWFTNADIYNLSQTITEEDYMKVIKDIVDKRNLHIMCRTSSGSFRICNKCNLIKPDRTHHCTVCNKCILKMDHHCPWVNNCIQYTNYKYFVLFLGYSVCLCFFTGLSSFPFLIKFWMNDLKTKGRFQIIFLFFISAISMITLASLFLYHLYLLIHNRSTFESFRPPILRQGPNKNAFNLGGYRNCLQIFGENKWKWLLPIKSDEYNASYFDDDTNRPFLNDCDNDEEIYWTGNISLNA